MSEKKTARKGYVRTLWTRSQEGAEDVMKMWKTGARRPDRIGDVSHRAMELVHRGTGAAIKSLTQLEKATVPPARTRHASPPAPQHGPTGKRAAGKSAS